MSNPDDDRLRMGRSKPPGDWMTGEPPEHWTLPEGAPLRPETENAEDSMEGPVGPGRTVLPDTRNGMTHKFSVYDAELGRQTLYVTGNRYEGFTLHRDHSRECVGGPDAPLGEVFLTGFGKEGSTLDGMTQWAMICLSIALQSGAELDMLCWKFAHMNFRPFGRVDGIAGVPDCHSIPGYVAEWLAHHFGSPELQAKLAEIRGMLRS